MTRLELFQLLEESGWIYELSNHFSIMSFYEPELMTQVCTWNYVEGRYYEARAWTTDGNHESLWKNLCDTMAKERQLVIEKLEDEKKVNNQEKNTPQA